MEEERIDAIEEEEEEEVIEEVEEEYEEVEEEVEEEEEEEVEEIEEEEGGDDSKEAEPAEKAVGSVDAAVEEAKQSDPASGSASAAGKIFVGGVSRETTEDTFTKHFKKYGEITDSVIMKEKHTQKPRGFGFITFADPSVIDKVLTDQHVIGGRTVEVKRTVPREDAAGSKGGLKTRKIFVGGIPTSLTEDEFKDHFGSYGKVIERQIMVDHSTGRSRGFGFITFEDEATVEKIVSKGKMHDLGGKQVEIKKAEPKKAGVDLALGTRAAYGAGGGIAHSRFGSGAYGYQPAGGYQPGSMYYGGRGGGGYGYGGMGYGAGYGAPYPGGPMHAAGGYAAGNGYGGPGGYGAYNGYGGGRGSGGRYHPYGR